MGILYGIIVWLSLGIISLFGLRKRIESEIDQKRRTKLTLKILYRGLVSFAFLITRAKPNQSKQSKLPSFESLFPGLRRCPLCDEIIRAKAIKCKKCGEWIEPIRPKTQN